MERVGGERASGEGTSKDGSGVPAWLATLLFFLYAGLLTTLVSYCLKGALNAAGVVHVDQVSWRLLSALAMPFVGEGVRRESIVILAIGDEYFEREFQQASPLNRAELAHIVETVERGLDATRPAVVAFDLDLSPLPAADSTQRAAQQRLDRALLALARKARVVALCPFAHTDALRQQQVAWAEEIAGAAGGRLMFAVPDLLVQVGAVLNYRGDVPSLGLVAGRWRADAARAPVDAPVAACGAPVAERGPTAKINFAGYRAYSLIELTRATPVEALLALQPYALVFVGGSYSLMSDQFMTSASDRLHGVEMHAAVAYSAGNPVGRMPYFADPLLQYSAVLLVMLLGRRATHRVFINLPTHGGSAGGVNGAAVRWMWAVPRDRNPLQVAEAWTRWVGGLLLLGLVFAFFVIAFGALSIGLMVAFGYWYDFLLAALVAFSRAASTEFRLMVDRLGGVASMQAGVERGVIGARPVLRVGFVLRCAVLAIGAIVLVDSLVA